MRISKNHLGVIFVGVLAFALGTFSGGTESSSASQRTRLHERFEYIVLPEQSVGRQDDIRKLGPLEPLMPPNVLQELLNSYGRDGWEIEECRLRTAHSMLKAARQTPAYYLYSYAGDNGPRFLRLRRRID